MVQSVTDNSITEAEFDILRNITPIRFELPLKTDIHSEFKQVVGDKLSSKKDRSSVKAGVYIFTNKSNGHCYVGSSTQLADRLLKNYLGDSLKNRKIDLALKELKLESFFLDVYVLPENMINSVSIEKIRILVLFLEQYYILLFNPDYNVLKVAGSSAGRVFSEDSLIKMRKAASNRALFGENNPMYGKTHNNETREIMAIRKKGHLFSEQAKANISAKLSGNNHPLFGTTRSEQDKLKMSLSQSSKIGLEVTDLQTNIVSLYATMREAAKAIDCRSSALSNYFSQSQVKPFRGRYLLRKIR